MKLTALAPFRAVALASVLVGISVLTLPAQPAENLDVATAPTSWFTYPGTLFVVERNGQPLGTFAEVSGIGSENDVIELIEGGDTGVVRKIPGRVRFLDVTLKRGITRDTTAWDWRQQVVDGDIQGARSAVTIKMFRGGGGPVAVWQLFNAWPSKITGPLPRTAPNQIAVEELIIVNEGTVRTQ